MLLRKTDHLIFSYLNRDPICVMISLLTDPPRKPAGKLVPGLCHLSLEACYLLEAMALHSTPHSHHTTLYCTPHHHTSLCTVLHTTLHYLLYSTPHCIVLHTTHHNTSLYTVLHTTLHCVLCSTPHFTMYCAPHHTSLCTVDCFQEVWPPLTGPGSLS